MQLIIELKNISTTTAARYNQIHLEERDFTIKNNKKDHESVRSIIKPLINPLDKDWLELVNIYTRQLADETCNLNEVVEIGEKE